MDETTVVVSGGFDDLRSGQVRLLEEAAKLGPLHVRLWSDDVVRRLEGSSPKFPEAERAYLLGAIRYVDRVTICRDLAGPDCLWNGPGAMPTLAVGMFEVSGEPPHAHDKRGHGTHNEKSLQPKLWIVAEAHDNDAKRAFCRAHGLQYRVLRQDELQNLPDCPDELPVASPRPRVMVTGCFDWFHSGHVRFFEEVSSLGDLFVIVGHDANIRLLKGEGHPLFPEKQRRYLVQSVRHVTQALISTGQGWLDAEPEIRRIKPQVYAVNEDGDRPEKRDYCQAHGIEYRVLKRLPKEGLPRRQSKDLRGF